MTHVPLGLRLRSKARAAKWAASVGAMVQIGSDCKISPRCILRDVVVDDGTVLAADTVAPFALFACTRRARSGATRGTPELFKELAVSEFERFKPSKKEHDVTQ